MDKYLYRDVLRLPGTEGLPRNGRAAVKLSRDTVDLGGRLVGRGDEVAVVHNFDAFHEPVVKRASIRRHVAGGAVALVEGHWRAREATAP